jgi:hypothetical protein
LKKLSRFTDEEAIKLNKGDQSITLPFHQIKEEDNKKLISAPKVFPNHHEEETHHHEEEPHHVLPQPHHNEEEPHHVLPQPHHNEEELHHVLQQPHHHEEEPHHVLQQPHHHEEEPHHHEEEETHKYYNIIGKENPKQSQAMKKQSKRPNINKHLENKKYEIENKLNRLINPININVSYNNPVALNEFNTPDTNMNKYRFDSGLDKNNSSYNVKENGQFFNSIKDSVNSTYYPAYLENPLNNNVCGTQIQQVRQQSNYEQDRQKQILTEKNSPAPVMLGNEWSEWAPI